MSRPARAVGHRITDASPEEDKAGLTEKVTAEHETSTNTLQNEKRDGKLPRGFGRIIRDESGAVVDVMLAEEEMTNREEAIMEKDFEIGSSSGQTEKLVVRPESRWLLEDRGKEGNPENEDKEELLEGMCILRNFAVRTAKIAAGCANLE